MQGRGHLPASTSGARTGGGLEGSGVLGVVVVGVRLVEGYGSMLGMVLEYLDC